MRRFRVRQSWMRQLGMPRLSRFTGLSRFSGMVWIMRFMRLVRFVRASVSLCCIAPAPVSWIRVKSLRPGMFRSRIIKSRQHRVLGTGNEVEGVVFLRESAKRRMSRAMMAPMRPSPMRPVWPKQQAQDRNGNENPKETSPWTSGWRLGSLYLVADVVSLIFLRLKERSLLKRHVAHG